MSEERVRYGTLGCGEIAVQSFNALAAASNARLVATFDVKPELAKDLAGRVEGAQACKSQDELLAREDVDAVIVSTPHHLHEPISIAALQAGKHVLVEKPIACTVAQGRRMVKAASKAKRKLGVCFMMRYSSQTEGVRNFIAEGHLGRITSWVIAGMMYKQESYWTGGYSQRAVTDWRLRRETAGGGYLIMNSIHTIDWFRYITGQEVVKAKSFGGTFNSPPGVEVEDLVAAAVLLSGGGVGIIGGASSVPGGKLGESRVIGTKGQINSQRTGGKGVEVYVTEATQVNGQTVPASEWTTVDFSGGKGGNSRTALIEAFGRWTQGEGEFLAPGDDAVKSLAVCEAIYKNAGLFIG
jgi:predicted dehydrogenase